ncbi:MAG: hypothetical protein AAFR17_04980 [Pseudomonadota bacterium]
MTLPGFDGAWGRETVALFQALSQQDRMTLISAFDAGVRPVLVTAKGSANDRFWGRLALIGWARPDTAHEDLPPDYWAGFSSWRLTERGLTSLPSLLQYAPEIRR